MIVKEIHAKATGYEKKIKRLLRKHDNLANKIADLNYTIPEIGRVKKMITREMDVSIPPHMGTSARKALDELVKKYQKERKEYRKELRSVYNELSLLY